MSFAPVFPWWLIIAVAAVLIYGCVWFAFGRPGYSRSKGTRLAPRSGEKLRWFRRAAIAFLLMAALLRPGLGGANVSSAAAQLDVVFVVDTTSSVVAEDYGNAQPRLSGVKADVQAISSKLPGAYFSMITFDKDAAVRLPLTSDTNALENSLQTLGPEITLYSRGSSVTQARQVLVSRLQAAQQTHPNRARVVYYLGDGEQTANSQPEPFEIPPGLISGGAVLGYGTAQGGKMKQNTGLSGSLGPGYIQDYSTGGAAVSKIDEGMLSSIAKQIEVNYVHRNAGDDIDAALGGVNSGSLTIDGSSNVQAQFELYRMLAIGILALAGWELFDSIREWRTLAPRGFKTKLWPFSRRQEENSR